MKILHLYSDWRWTGPAEPALHACVTLAQRGHDVLMAFRPPHPDIEECIQLKVSEAGVPGTTAFALDRYLHPVGTIGDFVKLPRFLRRERFDVVHTHLCHDHAVGGLCAKLSGRNRPVIVRSLYRRTVLRPTLGYRFLLRQLTDGALAFTTTFRDAYVNRFGLDPARVGVLPMTVDLARFDPARAFRDMRAEFGIAPEAPVIGIVGRFQKYRRMETFLEAAHRVLVEAPEVRFLVIGASSKIGETVVRPAQDLGVRDAIILTGYRIEDFVDVMACQDIFTLLMPGFDGTARAVREALALAKPCVVPRYGMLPDIVKHNETGLVVEDDSPEALARAWLELVRAPIRRAAMGAAARRDAEKRFGMEQLGPCLETFYERLIAGRVRRPV